MYGKVGEKRKSNEINHKKLACLSKSLYCSEERSDRDTQKGSACRFSQDGFLLIMFHSSYTLNCCSCKKSYFY